MGRGRSWGAVAGLSLWLLGQGVLAAPSAEVEQTLARAQLYSELAEQLGKVAQRKGSAPLRALGERLASEHQQANGRLAQFVLRHRLDLPAPVLDPRRKVRTQWVMRQLSLLETLEGDAFEATALLLVEALPSLWKEARSPDPALEAAVLEPLWSTLEGHRQAALSLHHRR